MEWQYDATTRTSIVRQAGYRATVWLTEASAWVAVITSGQTEVGRGHFRTREKAQTWCQTHLSRLVAAERGVE